MLVSDRRFKMLQEFACNLQNFAKNFKQHVISTENFEQHAISWKKHKNPLVLLANLSQLSFFYVKIFQNTHLY